MALIIEDRIMETSTTTGTGAMTLAGAYTGYRAFSSVCTSPSDTCYYMIEAVDGSGYATGEWETGLGTYSAASTLTRTTVSRSSNANAAVSFSAGTKRVSISQTAAQIAAGTASATTFNPGGRLTLVTATPVLTSDQTAKTTVYYTPHISDQVPVYSGTAWAAKTFTELSMALDTTNQLLGTLYDLFVWSNAGTMAIGAGPAWINTATITVTIATPAVVSWTAHGLVEGDPVVFTTTGALPTGITAGTTYFVGNSPAANTFNISTTVANAAAGTFVATSGTQSGVHTATNPTKVRGAGAGTTELQLKNGIWTNKNSITLKNGAGAGTAGIAANTATYVGTIYCTANGQTGVMTKPAAAAGGSNAFLGVYNAYNRIRTMSFSADNTASWSYASTTWRAWNGNVSNRISYVDGLAQSPLMAHAMMVSGAGYLCVGVNRDATVGAPVSTLELGAGTTSAGGAGMTEPFPPSLGFHYMQAMESAASGTGTPQGSATAPTRQMNSLSIEIEL